jgi:hypothetical protein
MPPCANRVTTRYQEPEISRRAGTERAEDARTDVEQHDVVGRHIIEPRPGLRHFDGDVPPVRRPCGVADLPYLEEILRTKGRDAGDCAAGRSTANSTTASRLRSHRLTCASTVMRHATVTREESCSATPTDARVSPIASAVSRATTVAPIRSSACVRRPQARLHCDNHER